MRKHHDVFFYSGFRVQGSGGGFAAKKEANPASLRSAAPSKGRGSRGCSLLPLEGGAPKGRRLDGDSGMKESEEMRSPFPMRGRLIWGRLRREYIWVMPESGIQVPSHQSPVPSY